MIRSFGSKDAERIWHEQYVKRVDRTVQRATLRSGGAKRFSRRAGTAALEEIAQTFRGWFVS